MMKRLRLIAALLILFFNVTGLFAQNETFSVSLLTSEVNLNPQVSYTSTEAQIYTAIYEGLVTYDPYSLDPLPAIARRWEVSDDGRTYRFSIRSSARYSNGDPILASHFRDTWLSLLNPATDAPYASLFDVVEGAQAYRTGETDDPDTVGIKVLGPRTLEVQLEIRATHFLRILCHHAFVVVHPDMLGRESWSANAPLVVSGPYVIDSMTDDEMHLTRNENYWDERNVDIKQISIRFSDDYDAVTQSFNNGELDWARGAIDLGLVERQESIVVNPLFATTYFQFSAATPPFDDERVRRAMALLLPWDQIRSEDFQYLPTETLVPSIPFYPEVTGISGQDRDKALELLDEAGYPHGRGLPTIRISIPGGVENDRIVTLMKQTWQEELGLQVETESIAYPDYFDILDSGNFMISTLTWIGDFADPLTFLEMWTKNSNLNNSAYSNPEFDALVRRAMGETGDSRYETLAQAETILLHDAIVLPVSNSPSINLIDLELIDGWYPNPLDVHPFKFLALSTGRPLPNVALLSLFLKPWQGFSSVVFDPSVTRRFQLGLGIPIALSTLGLMLA